MNNFKERIEKTTDLNVLAKELKCLSELIISEPCTEHYDEFAEKITTIRKRILSLI